MSSAEFQEWMNYVSLKREYEEKAELRARGKPKNSQTETIYLLGGKRLAPPTPGATEIG